MDAFNSIFIPPLIIIAILLFLASGLIWLFGCHGIDRLKHPEEWKDAGSSGEQITYLTLRDKIHVPENQILRNVYIPTSDGKTSEIDMLVVSRKALLVFECKNYAGNIYGDMNRKKWIQYLGRQKNFFYNPFLQNRTHVKHLKAYLAKYGDLPIIPFVTTITRGNWKVKNLGENDYLLGYNSHIKDVLAKQPDSKLILAHFNDIMKDLQPLSRPDDSIKEKHIEQIKNRKNK